MNKLTIVFAVAMFSMTTSFAQSGRPSGFSKSSSSRNAAGEQGGEKGKEKKDTIKFRLKVFELLNNHTLLTPNKLDTAFNDFQNYSPIRKKSISTQDLGNLGSAAQSNDFFARQRNSDGFLFGENLRSYGKFGPDIRFYNTTKPFTLLEYGQWFSNKPKGETWLHVFHTQNVNSNLNVGFSYNSIGSQGKYLSQEAKNNNLNFFSSYNIDRYDLWLTVGKNKFTNQENGGIIFPTDIENPDLKPENIPVWLANTSTVTKNTFALITHQYKFGTWVETRDKKEIFQKFIPRFSIMHTLDYSNNSRGFTEVDPNPYFLFTDGRGKVNFYGADSTPFINGAAGTSTQPGTQDNSGYRRLTNIVYLRALEAPDRKYTFGKQAYIGSDFIHYYYPRQEMIYTPGILRAPLGLTQSDSKNNTFVGGSIYRTDAKFLNWNGAGRYYIQGYRFGDFDLSGYLEKPIRTHRDTASIRVFGQMTNTSPDVFFQKYYSNHYQWNNNFKKTYTLRVGGYYESPLHHLKIGGNYAIVSNYIYWSDKIVPDQASSEFSLLQVYLNKDFNFGDLHLTNSMMYQTTTTDTYFHLPTFSTRNTVYYTGVLSKVLHYQIGVDFRFDTKYYADYYSPALTAYYVQHTEKIGGYPWMDGFINLKLKRTKFYLKYSNLSEKFIRRDYFTTPGYPAQISLACFGISWTFYD